MRRESSPTVHDRSGRVVAASLRTPPWNQVLSWIDELEAIDALVAMLGDRALGRARAEGRERTIRRRLEQCIPVSRRVRRPGSGSFASSG